MMPGMRGESGAAIVVSQRRLRPSDYIIPEESEVPYFRTWKPTQYKPHMGNAIEAEDNPQMETHVRKATALYPCVCPEGYRLYLRKVYAPFVYCPNKFTLSNDKTPRWYLSHVTRTGTTDNAAFVGYVYQVLGNGADYLSDAQWAELRRRCGL